MPHMLRKGIDSAGGLFTSGAPKVFINGSAVVRVGDTIAPHGSGAHGSAVMVQGSSKVFINNVAVCRVGDAASCGDVGTGGITVNAG